MCWWFLGGFSDGKHFVGGRHVVFLCLIGGFMDVDVFVDPIDCCIYSI